MTKRPFIDTEFLFVALDNISLHDYKLIHINDEFNSINITNEKNETLLMKVTEQGNLDLVKFFVANRALLNLTCMRGETALEKALKVKDINIDIITCLLDNGATTRDYKLRDFLLEAFDRRNLELILLLARFGATIFHIKLSPVSYCCILGDIALLLLLLNEHIHIQSINIPDESYRTPLLHACRSTGRYNISKVLIEHGADINYYPLHNESGKPSTGGSNKYMSAIERIC